VGPEFAVRKKVAGGLHGAQFRRGLRCGLIVVDSNVIAYCWINGDRAALSLETALTIQ